MDKPVCAVCQVEFKDFTALHRHLKAHKTTQVEYYQKYFPRYDKYSGNFILFKNKDFYMNSDFNSRENLIAWLDKQTPDAAKSYLVDYFRRYIDLKNWVYTPSQVELRSSLMPGMLYLEKLFGSYYDFAADLGLKNRFSKTEWDVKLKDFEPRHFIVTDTREQHPLHFSIRQQTLGLKFGDYRLSDDKFSGRLVIERKAVSDFYSTMYSGFSRFGREIQKALKAKSKFVILIEGDMQDLNQHYAMLRARNIHVPPELILHNMRVLCQTFPTIQFLFVKNRAIASRVIELLFRTGGKFSDFDLQYMYDTGKLCGTNLPNT